jgi:hypothetical protein
LGWIGNCRPRYTIIKQCFLPRSMSQLPPIRP